MSNRVDYAVFDDEQAMLDSIRACRSLHLSVGNAWTPYPVHGIDELLELRPTRLPWATFVAGTLGVCLALLFEYWSSAADWPLNVGGKPFDSLPAFVPVAFESLVLFAGLTTAFVLFLRSGLRPGRKRRILDERLTDDRFAIRIDRTDASVTDGEVADLLEQHGAVHAWSEVED